MRVSLVIDAFGLGGCFMWAERSLTDAKRSVSKTRNACRICQPHRIADAGTRCYPLTMRCREQLLRPPSRLLAKSYRCNHERFHQLQACRYATDCRRRNQTACG